MLRRIVLVSVFSFYMSGYTLAASFTTINEIMNWEVDPFKTMVSDDASTIVISLGSNGDFIWKLGAITLLPDAIYRNLNADGSVLVGDESDRAIVYQSGTLTYLDYSVANPVYGHARSISNNGSIIAGFSSGQACVWNNGIRQDLGFLDDHIESESIALSGDGSTVAGKSWWGGQESSFVWSGEALEPVLAPEGFESWVPEAVSYDGTKIVGGYEFSYYWNACVFSDGTNTPLEILEGFSRSRANDISADGSIIVGSNAFMVTIGNRPYPRNRAVIWDDQNRAQLLQSVLEDDWNLDLTGWTLKNAIGISDDGSMIYGDGTAPDGKERYWIAQIPEPTTFMLLAASSYVLLRRTRKR